MKGGSRIPPSLALRARRKQPPSLWERLGLGGASRAEPSAAPVKPARPVKLRREPDDRDGRTDKPDHNHPDRRQREKAGKRDGKRQSARPYSFKRMVRKWLESAAAPPAAAVLTEARSRSNRLWMVLVFSLFLLFLRAAWLMGLPDSDLEARGRGQYQTVQEMKGRRGVLYDRNNRELAVTVSLPALYMNPARLPEEKLKKRLPDLARVIGKPESWVLEQYQRKTQENKKLQRVLLGEKLEPVGARTLVSGVSRDMLWLEEEPVRMYPGQALAAPLLGFVDATGVGAAGLEKVLETDLAGDTWRVMLTHDRKGRAINPGRDEQRLARQGHSVRLTIDSSIQHVTEEALWKAMVQSVPESAMAVVVEIKTGAILAMASVPAGNPNDSATRNKHELFKNHAAMDQVEPGSVMKPFVMAAAIEEGLIRPESYINCEMGSWGIGGKIINDDHPKGVITASEVIKYSSNIGTAKIAMMLGAERTLRYLSDFGFARPTGLKIPGEVRGLMRAPASIRPLELATTAFGQGVTASPIQLAAALAALSNGGVRMVPYIIDAVLDRYGEVETWNEPRVERRVVSEHTAGQLIRMMETVIEEGGTGTRAAVPGYTVGGKTGTAQKVENGIYSPTKRVSSFAGFLPAEDPTVAIVVVVDSPTVGSKYGGIVAGPAFSEIGAFTMRYLGIKPTAEPGSAAPGSAASGSAAPGSAAPVEAPVVDVQPLPIEILPDGEGGWVLPDLRGRTMRAAVTALQPAGVALSLSGNGRVVGQSPTPGSRIAPGDAVFLSFD